MIADASCLPDWVPDAARHYLVHTEIGLPIRAVARDARVHASTVLRQVRRVESRRDDPLVDGALRHLSDCLPRRHPSLEKEQDAMKTQPNAIPGPVPDSHWIEREGGSVLARLAQSGALLAVARDMEKGVIIREGIDGEPVRLGVVDRALAEALALSDWISCAEPTARIARYRITATGRSALRRIEAEHPQGPGEAQDPDGRLRHMRTLMADSPLTGLARRRDRDGKPFLGRDLLGAAERLREDFEISHLGPRVAQDWDGFLAAGNVVAGPSQGPAFEARDRVIAALRALGPGLADVALRCCCFLEGMESFEQRMGWSARSGKIVLRIALQRLRQHYDSTQGRFGPRIG